jgi:hypothetical protein
VLAFDPRGGSVETTLIKDQAELHCPLLAGFTANRRKVCDYTRTILKIHRLNIQLAG